MNFVHVLPQALEIGTDAGNTFAYVPHHLLKDGHSSFKACLRRAAAAAATGYPEAGKGNHVWGFALSSQFRRSNSGWVDGHRTIFIKNLTEVVTYETAVGAGERIGVGSPEAAERQHAPPVHIVEKDPVLRAAKWARVVRFLLAQPFLHQAGELATGLVCVAHSVVPKPQLRPYSRGSARLWGGMQPRTTGRFRRAGFLCIVSQPRRKLSTGPVGAGAMLMVRHYGVAVVGTGLGLVRACLLSQYGRERAPMSGASA
jgi:hypothetical protein